MTIRVLLVEDDASLAKALSFALREAGYAVVPATRLPEAIHLAAQADVVVTDVCLPDAPDAGITLVGELRKRHPGCEIVVMTGYATVAQAVEAMRLGARIYLQKPFDNAVLLRQLDEVATLLNLRRVSAGRGELVGASRAMRAVYAAIDLAASCDLSVLIQGETGVGKELAAQAVHDLSRRQNRPFIPVNCAAVPRELADSEFFGHEAGAFTGAQQRKPGKFQLAHGGTLFLDEINSLPLELQPKLLRVLETGKVWPIGASAPTTVDVRILSAANVGLEGLAATGAFRQDLLYRLKVLEIALPPLCEHLEDIPAIAMAALERTAPDEQRFHLSGSALAALMTRSWPGNVRELMNVVRKGAALAAANRPAPVDQASTIIITELHLGLGDALAGLPFKEAQERATDDWSRRTVLAALAACQGQIAQAADHLRMDRSALYKLIRRLGISGKGLGVAEMDNPGAETVAGGQQPKPLGRQP